MYVHFAYFPSEQTVPSVIVSTPSKARKASPHSQRNVKKDSDPRPEHDVIELTDSSPERMPRKAGTPSKSTTSKVSGTDPQPRGRKGKAVSSVIYVADSEDEDAGTS
jgi:hypothetical protein